jgi:hypothetical protein
VLPADSLQRIIRGGLARGAALHFILHHFLFDIEYSAGHHVNIEQETRNDEIRRPLVRPVPGLRNATGPAGGA